MHNPFFISFILRTGKFRDAEFFLARVPKYVKKSTAFHVKKILVECWKVDGMWNVGKFWMQASVSVEQ